ncbi:GntR family transcriptional regulator [Enterococcus sp. JM9B]|uniref:GntR family transcriptional regulator n=1 Tax=Enterococcus sp. JM9B TaxID=1857216 RepID=UPI001374C335|nr:GntR family transcriptional regulator [Enterococcus sp. JM9B]KAF1303900.1 GntR family transcriptional regulator [Enterococcus sp. JM9B]
MLLEIDSRSEEPIYRQISDQIILGIARGDLQVNEQLPSVRQLADELGVNMMTIAKAYTFLKEAGYLITDRRKGTTVRLPENYREETQQDYQNQLAVLLAQAVLHHRSEKQILADVHHYLKEFTEGRD